MVAPANALDRRDPSTVRPTPSRAAADELHFPSVADAADEDDSELYQNQTRRTLPCRAVGCRGRMRTSRRRRVSASAGSSSAMPNDCSHCCASAKTSATEVYPAMSAAGPPLVRREHSERRGCVARSGSAPGRQHSRRALSRSLFYAYTQSAWRRLNEVARLGLDIAGRARKQGEGEVPGRDASGPREPSPLSGQATDASTDPGTTAQASPRCARKHEST